MKLNPVGDKFRAFNFHVIECNGNNIGELRAAFNEARSVTGRPTCIVAQTFMGRGVSFMEDDYRWHGKPPNPEQAEEALKELEILTEVELDKNNQSFAESFRRYSMTMNGQNCNQRRNDASL